MRGLATLCALLCPPSPRPFGFPLGVPARYGIEVGVVGFSDKLAALLNQALETVTSLKLNRDRLELVREGYDAHRARFVL